MGLDVYLYKCADRVAAKSAEDAAGKESEGIWHFGGLKYEQLTEAQKDEARAKVEAIDQKHGIKDGQHNSVERVELASTIDPENLFKVGYFRSNYNEGGINNIMRTRGLPTLDDILGYQNEYEFHPDWDTSLQRVNDAIQQYESHLASNIGNLDIFEARSLPPHGAKDKTDALKIFRAELEGSMQRGDWYSNRAGNFIPKGIRVLGIVDKALEPQSNNRIENFLNTPSVFVIYEKESDEKEDWYLTALKIVRETIEYVIAQPDRANYYLHWSS